MSRIILITFTLVCFSIFGFLFYTFLQPQTMPSPTEIQVVTAQTVIQPTVLPVQTVNQNEQNQPVASIGPIPTKNHYTQISPDGLYELLLEIERVSPQQITYTVSVTETTTGNHHAVFTESIDTQTNVRIPFNTWSADNKYFFLTLHTKTEQRNLVFKASGELIDDLPYINVNSLYHAKEIAYEFKEMTGWASQNLLVINTNKADGNGMGPSYWFDVTSKKFIQLSSQF